MTLAEVLNANSATRKLIWSKRGDQITRKVVDRMAPFDIQPRTQLAIKDDADVAA